MSRNSTIASLIRDARHAAALARVDELREAYSLVTEHMGGDAAEHLAGLADVVAQLLMHVSPQSQQLWHSTVQEITDEMDGEMP